MAEKCPRCSECRNRDHHWMPNPDFGNDPAVADHPVAAEWVCKHCSSVGMDCRHCFGTGEEPGLEGEEPCSCCGGEGVIERLVEG